MKTFRIRDSFMIYDTAVSLKIYIIKEGNPSRGTLAYTT